MGITLEDWRQGNVSEEEWDKEAYGDDSEDIEPYTREADEGKDFEDTEE